MSLRLKVITGAAGSLPLGPGETKLIGRGAGVDLNLADEGLTGRHAVVMVSAEGAVSLVDLGKPGGTRLNGEALPVRVPQPLQPGDRIGIGRCLLQLEQGTGGRLGKQEPVLPPEFQQVRELGRGATGRVLAAWWEPRARWVALKLLQRRVDPGSTEHRRFVREAELVQRIRSPYVVEVYELRVEPEQTIIVLELVEGRTLREAIDASPGGLPVPEALTIAWQVAQALAAAVQVGVVHRDVKPANILLGSAGAKLCDFGLAKDRSRALATLTAPGTAMGSLSYIPPEQLRDAKQADAQADVYGLGATLYHLLAGTPPFRVNDLDDLLNTLTAEPPPLRERRPNCPPAAAELVHAMLAKEPYARPPLWKVVERLGEAIA